MYAFIHWVLFDLNTIMLPDIVPPGATTITGSTGSMAWPFNMPPSRTAASSLGTRVGVGVGQGVKVGVGVGVSVGEDVGNDVGVTTSGEVVEFGPGVWLPLDAVPTVLLVTSGAEGIPLNFGV